LGAGSSSVSGMLVAAHRPEKDMHLRCVTESRRLPVAGGFCQKICRVCG